MDMPLETIIVEALRQIPPSCDSWETHEWINAYGEDLSLIVGPNPTRKRIVRLLHPICKRCALRGRFDVIGYIVPAE